MKIRNWHIGRNDSKLQGITDKMVLQDFTCKMNAKAGNSLTLVGITEKGPRTWSQEQELKEMQGHLNGLVRSRYGREMLDARKLAMAERLKIGGMRPSGTTTPC